MENHNTNYEIVIKNTKDIYKHLDYYFNYKIDDNITELTAKEIFDIISKHITKISFGKYLLDYIAKKEPALNNSNINFIIKSCSEKFQKNGLINCKSIFDKKKTTITAELLRKQLRNWFDNVTPSRENVFLLAFALEMSCDELLDFLTKGICDKDINYKNPAEIAAYSSLKMKKGYGYSLWLVNEAEQIAPKGNEIKKNVLTGSYRSAYERLCTENELIKYIAELISEDNDPKTSVSIQECYKSLIKEIAEYAVLDKKISVANETGIKIASKSGIPFGTIERYIYYYVPVKNGIGHYKTDSYAPYKNGNIMGRKNNIMKEQKWFFSTLLRRSDLKKMYLSEKNISRDTILTLAFFKICEENPDYNTYEYISDINDHLIFCRFEQINFAYPYDLFIFMCLQTDDPLASFRKIWEMSWIK